MPNPAPSKTAEQRGATTRPGSVPQRAAAAPGPLVDVLRLQRHAGNQAVGQWLSGGGAASPSDGGAPSAIDGARPLRAASAITIQRKATSSAPSVSSDQGRDVEPSSPARRLIVDDETDTLERGQLRKSEFLEALRVRVCEVAEEGLRGTIWSAQGCPYIERWFAHYSKQPAAQVERALLKYAPESGAAGSGAEYVEYVTSRVKRGMVEWRRSGEVAGLPPEFAEAGMPGVTLSGLVSVGLTAVGRAISGAVKSVGRAIGSAVAGAARMLFKQRATGSGGSAHPGEVQQRLGRGQSLDSGARMRMEGAFGTSFAHVRVHTDTRAAKVADELGAHAFTVGRDVAFGSGEYRPGTMIGDALLAHELAHVVQQNGAAPATAARADSGTGEGVLEADADVAAAGAVGLLWGGAPGARPELPMPRRRSGLALRRCGGDKKKTETAADKERKAKAAAEAKRRARFTPAGTAKRDAALAKASGELKAVGKWVDEAQGKQGVPEDVAVVNLDPKERKRVEGVVATLKTFGGQADTSGLDAVRLKIDVVTKELNEIRTVEDRYSALSRSSDAAGEALEALAAASKSVDGYELSLKIEELIDTLDGMKGTREKSYEFDRQLLRQRVDAITSNIRQVKDDAAKMPKAIETVVFVLESFLRVNTPNSAPPDPAEIKKFSTAKTDQAENAFRLVFKSNESLGFFLKYAERLIAQIKVHQEMRDKKAPASRFVPTQQDVRAYFRKLAGAPNKEVAAAYEAYARAYYLHRGHPTLEDMKVNDASELFKRQPSITGIRLLVCSGYAQLGAFLLREAGGTLVKFVNGVAATPQELIDNRFSDGHSIAHIRRKGSDMFVSNDEIVPKLQDGLDLLKTDDPASRIFQARAADQLTSVNNLVIVLQKARAAPGRRSGRRP